MVAGVAGVERRSATRRRKPASTSAVRSTLSTVTPCYRLEMVETDVVELDRRSFEHAVNTATTALIILGTYYSPMVVTSVSRYRASVTRPAGLVKFSKIATGANRSMSAAMSSATGIVEQCVGEPADTDGLLADQSEHFFELLVTLTCCSPADAHQRYRQISMRRFRPRRSASHSTTMRQSTRSRILRASGPRTAGPRRVGVDEMDPTQVERVASRQQTLDEFGGVGGTAPDDTTLHDTPSALGVVD